MSNQIAVLKRDIMKLLDSNPTGPPEIEGLLEQYWRLRGTLFEKKMTAAKIYRADRFDWKRPKLGFSLIRHPGGKTRQTWEYDFDTNQATLLREGKIPQSVPYKPDADAVAIVNAMLTEVEHPAVLRKGELLVINPRKIPELVKGPKQTVEGRAKRLKARVEELMKPASDFERAQYRNMLAYRKRTSGK